MVVDYPTFIGMFPEFTNAVEYPQAQFTLWEAQAELQFDPNRFGNILPLAIMLYVAHNISLSAEAAKVISTGGLIGTSMGTVASKTVGPVSVSYDNGDSSSRGSGEFDTTSYGRRLWRLIRAASSGPIYVPGRRRAMLAYPGFPGVRCG